MSQASLPDQSESISSFFALSGNEYQGVDPGNLRGDPCRFARPGPGPEASLEWRGPVSFARAYRAVPGIERDFGSRWGSNGDQRVSLRVEVGSDTGLLYVYDPTWDEYAVIGSDVPLAAVENVFARSPQLGEHSSVEAFVTLLPKVSAVRPIPGHEL